MSKAGKTTHVAGIGGSRSRGRGKKVRSEMKAGSRFLNAVSAVALSAGVVASGAGALTLVLLRQRKLLSFSGSMSVVQAASVPRLSRQHHHCARQELLATRDIDNSVKQLYAHRLFLRCHDHRFRQHAGRLRSGKQLINQLSSTATARSRTTSWQASSRRMPQVPTAKRRSRPTSGHQGSLCRHWPQRSRGDDAGRSARRGPRQPGFRHQ